MDKTQINSIIKRSKICRLALSDGNQPYIVPMSFGYDDKNVFFHTGRKEGKKIRILKKNNRVCIEFEIVSGLVQSEKPCNFNIKYESAIGYGKASLIDDIDEKKKALSLIIKQYSEKEFELEDKAVQATSVIKVEIENLTGRSSN